MNTNGKNYTETNLVSVKKKRGGTIVTSILMYKELKKELYSDLNKIQYKLNVRMNDVISTITIEGLSKTMLYAKDTFAQSTSIADYIALISVSYNNKIRTANMKYYLCDFTKMMSMFINEAFYLVADNYLFHYPYRNSYARFEMVSKRSFIDICYSSSEFLDNHTSKYFYLYGSAKIDGIVVTMSFGFDTIVEVESKYKKIDKADILLYPSGGYVYNTKCEQGTAFNNFRNIQDDLNNLYSIKNVIGKFVAMYVLFFQYINDNVSNYRKRTANIIDLWVPFKTNSDAALYYENCKASKFNKINDLYNLVSQLTDVLHTDRERLIANKRCIVGTEFNTTKFAQIANKVYRLIYDNVDNGDIIITDMELAFIITNGKKYTTTSKTSKFFLQIPIGYYYSNDVGKRNGEYVTTRLPNAYRVTDAIKIEV